MLFQINDLTFFRILKNWLDNWFDRDFNTLIFIFNVFLNSSCLAHSIDQRFFLFFHRQLLRHLVFFPYPAYFAQPTARVCSTNSSVDLRCTERRVHQSDLMIQKLKIETCFPIPVVVCVSFSSSVGTQNDPKSKTTRSLKICVLQKLEY